MRCAIIENGVVVNIADADEAFALSQGWIPSDIAKIGDLWDGENFITPAPTPAPPIVLKASQIMSALTHEETENLIDLLASSEVITPERATELKGG